MADKKNRGSHEPSTMGEEPHDQEVVMEDEAFLSVATVGTSDDAIITKTLKGAVTSWNRSAERIYGFSASEMLGKSISVLIPLGQKDEVPEILERIQRGESIRHYETARKRKDGQIIRVSVSISPVKDKKGLIIGASSIARDITAEVAGRRQAEEKLSAASQYARSLIEASLDPLVTISANGKITDVNAATIKVTGIPREQLIGTDFSNYFTEPEKAREGYQQVFARGSVIDYPLTIRHRDGRLTDVLYNAGVYKDPLVNVLGVFAAARDVTAQKQAFQYARSLIESSLDPLVTISADGKVTDVNEATTKVTGIPREELIGTDFSTYFTEPEKAREGYQQVFASGSVTDYPLTIRHKDGHLTDVLYNASVYKDTRGNVLGVFAAARDITARKKAEAAVQKEQQRLYDVLETVPVMISLLTPDYHVAFANRSFRNKFGEAGGRHCYDYCFGRPGPCEFCESYKVLETGKPHHWEVTSPDGKSIFEAYDYPFTDVDGSPLILEMDIDMTERRQAEKTLRKAHEDLKEEMAKREKAEQQLQQAQKLEAIGTLTGGIAHDFNNILATIVINSEMALLDVSGGSTLRSNLELILKSGLRGRELVRQMLLFSRKSEKKQEIVPLTPLIKETFGLLRSSLLTTIEIKLQLETEFDSVYADPSQIQQVIMNLCTNAAYAMRGTMGSIDLSLRDITFSSFDLPEADMQPGDYLVLSIKDTGSGMEEEVKKRIFEPFFTTKPVGEGTGLGLPVVYGIVKNHGGNITVYSEPGKGSIFRVYLPKADASLSVREEVIKPIPRGKERILIVDDEELIINSVQNMLGHLGYKVTAFLDGKEALKVFSGNPYQFDLVMTDQTMPFMTGENLGKQMMRIRPNIPVILCTGYSDLISSEKATALGFRGYVMKPFTVREGAELVRKVLDQARS